jgi:hypothetical protein
MAQVAANVAPVPQQSGLLAAAGIATPPAVNSGEASLHTIAVAEDYLRDVKRRKRELVPTAVATDVSAAEVFLLHRD